MRYTILLLSTIALTLLTSFEGKRKLVVTSPGFSSNGNIPQKYTCEGVDTNPPLHIANIPSNAQSLALVIHDPDAQISGGMTQFVAWDIEVRSDIPENFKGGTVGVNSYIRRNYKGMCPPSGPHHYHFKVYALDKKLNLDLNTDKDGLEEKMEGHILAEGELVGLYEKRASAMK